CRRRRTPTSPNWPGASPAGSSATWPGCSPRSRGFRWPTTGTCRRTRSRCSTRWTPCTCCCPRSPGWSPPCGSTASGWPSWPRRASRWPPTSPSGWSASGCRSARRTRSPAPASGPARSAASTCPTCPTPTSRPSPSTSPRRCARCSPWRARWPPAPPRAAPRRPASASSWPGSAPWSPSTGRTSPRPPRGSRPGRKSGRAGRAGAPPGPRPARPLPDAAPPGARPARGRAAGRTLHPSGAGAGRSPPRSRADRSAPPRRPVRATAPTRGQHSENPLRLPPDAVASRIRGHCGSRSLYSGSERAGVQPAGEGRPMREPDGARRGIRAQLNRIVLIPGATFLVLFAMLAAVTLTQAASRYLDYRGGREGVYLVQALTELQAERRLAAEQIADPSDGALSGLRTQAEATDAAIASLEEAGDRLRTSGPAASAFRTELGRLDGLRARVAAGDADLSAALDGYGAVVRHGIGAYDALTRTLHHGPAAAAGSDAVALMRAQELFAEADARLSADPGSRARPTALIGAARLRLDEAAQVLTGRAARTHAELTGSAAWDRTAAPSVEDWRDSADEVG